MYMNFILIFLIFKLNYNLLSFLLKYSSFTKTCMRMYTMYKCMNVYIEFGSVSSPSLNDCANQSCEKSRLFTHLSV